MGGLGAVLESSLLNERHSGELGMGQRLGVCQKNSQ